MAVTLIVSHEGEVEEYRKAYPGLLNNLRKTFIADDYHIYEGWLPSRVFIAESVPEDHDIVSYMKSSLMKQEAVDIFPIWLRYDWRRYGWDYKELLRKYMAYTHEEGEVVWEPEELEELKRVAAG